MRNRGGNYQQKLSILKAQLDQVISGDFGDLQKGEEIRLRSELNKLYAHEEINWILPCSMVKRG